MDWRHVSEVMAAAQGTFTEFKNLCVWAKSNGGMGSLYRSQHELFFVFKSGTAPHVNNVELGKHGRYRTNIWSYAGANSFSATRDDDLALHPTVKPVALVADAMLDCSRRKGIVLDAFAGSGTTLVAAERTGRRGYGIELDPLYCDVIVRRMARVAGLQALHAVTGCTLRRGRTTAWRSCWGREHHHAGGWAMSANGDDEQKGFGASGHGKQPTERRVEGNSTAAEASVKAKPKRSKRAKDKPKKVDLTPLLLERVRVRKGGQESKMPAYEAIIRKQVEKAVKERTLSAMKDIIKLAIEYDLVVLPPPAPNSGGVLNLRMSDEDLEKFMNRSSNDDGIIDALLRKYT